MKKRVKQILILVLIISSGLLYYELVTVAKYSTETFKVTQVIDGDTIVLSDGEHVRLLGINTPEKEQPYYQEAKDYMKELVEGKEVDVENHGKDKYQRTLAYVYFNGESVNQKQLFIGYANLYYYGTDEKYEKMKNAEQYARENELGLWRKSSSFGCIKLISLKYKDNGKCNNQEQIILENSCENLSVIIKDDANHIYDENINSGQWSKNFSCIWNDAGDTLMIRDKQGLVLWWRY
jgi:micrococcal nuclease